MKTIRLTDRTWGKLKLLKLLTDSNSYNDIILRLIDFFIFCKGELEKVDFEGDEKDKVKELVQFYLEHRNIIDGKQ